MTLKHKEYLSLIKEFEHIPMRPFDQKREYISTLSYELIGTGTSRLVFDLGDGFVLKVADTEDGKVQNYNEFLLSGLLSKHISTLTPVRWINSSKPDEARFLVMKHGACHEPSFEGLESIDDAFEIEFLGLFGLNTNELELPGNSYGLNFIDYGCTLDSNPIEVETISWVFEKGYKELLR